ncbi:unnamed protein product [Camellia sinensis]
MRRTRNGTCCRAEFSQDVAFTVVIGACILNSVFFPFTSGSEDDDQGDSLIDSTDARFAVHEFHSLLQLAELGVCLVGYWEVYIVYSLVYLASYLR